MRNRHHEPAHAGLVQLPGQRGQRLRLGLDEGRLAPVGSAGPLEHHERGVGAEVAHRRVLVRHRGESAQRGVHAAVHQGPDAFEATTGEHTGEHGRAQRPGGACHEGTTRQARRSAKGGPCRGIQCGANVEHGPIIAGTMQPRRPVIVIVEDEPGIADTLQYALRTEGFEPRWCATGEAALAGCDDAALVILDVGLPDLNGFEVFKRLRARHAALPVLFLTARADEIDRVVGLELGADDYVTKPFSPRELVARVRTVLRRSAPPPATPAVPAAASAPAQPFMHDEGRRSIRYYGEVLELSRYEYGLLRTLIGRPGFVFTRERLLDLVWDDDSASLDRTVDAHVKTLRAKLKAVAPTLEPIRTHRGVGYALAEDLPPARPA